MRVLKLHNAIAAVCPIDGINIGREEDRSTWSASFKAEATEEQRAAAQAVIDAFNPTPDPVELRAERYKAEADPFLVQALGYTLELERENDAQKRTTIQSKRALVVDAYMDAKRKIRQEIP